MHTRPHLILSVVLAGAALIWTAAALTGQSAAATFKAPRTADGKTAVWMVEAAVRIS